MEENVRFYICPVCGNVIGLINGDIENIRCCGSEMDRMDANSVDVSKEKHLPIYEKVGEEIIVRVGEIVHPMEKEHYISWIALVSENQTTRIALKPGEEPTVKFHYVPNSYIYACCNRHGLWKTKVE